MKEKIEETGYWVATCLAGEPLVFHKVTLEDVSEAEGGYGLYGYRTFDPIRPLKNPKKERLFVSPLKIENEPQVNVTSNGQISGQAWYRGNSEERLVHLKKIFSEKIEEVTFNFKSTLESIR